MRINYFIESFCTICNKKQPKALRCNECNMLMRQSSKNNKNLEITIKQVALHR